MDCGGRDGGNSESIDEHNEERRKRTKSDEGECRTVSMRQRASDSGRNRVGVGCECGALLFRREREREVFHGPGVDPGSFVSRPCSTRHNKLKPASRSHIQHFICH